MPYICTTDNRYIGEHTCNQYHYGNQEMVRDCCVDDAKERAATVLRVAITDQHPAYRLWLAAWNNLTEAERVLAGDIVPVYDHGPAGFKATSYNPQHNLALID